MADVTRPRPAPSSDLVGGLDRYADTVLEVVEAIPVGRVLSYGDIAEIVGVAGPRQVGTVLSRYGSDVPWWRVVHADGTPAEALAGTAACRYAAEGTPLRGETLRVDMAVARWQPTPAELASLGDDVGGPWWNRCRDAAAPSSPAGS